MGRWGRGAAVAAAFLVWVALASVGGLWGWRQGASGVSVPQPCECPFMLPVVAGGGLLGAVFGVGLASAAMGAVGLLLYVRSRRRRGTDVDASEPPPDGVEAWLSEVADSREP